MTETSIKTQLEDILKKVAEQKNITDYKIEIAEESLRGDGYLGEIFQGSIVDNSKGDTSHFVIKKPLPAEHTNPLLLPGVNVAYDGEIHFYETILPALDNFQREKAVERPFTATPAYFFGSSQHGKQVVVMNNIKFIGYELLGKDHELDQSETEESFKVLAKFHALSFCLKDQRPEEYKKLAEWEGEDLLHFFTCKTSSMKNAITSAAQICLKYLDDTKDAGLRARLQDYAENGLEIFKNGLEYRGMHGCILHGDCWTNNMMFKHDAGGKVEAIKMLDFQAVRTGSLVGDLSYFLYVGGHKSLFDKLDDLLKVYHKRFCDFARELGSDPEVLLPWEALKEEWKTYAKVGICMSLLVARAKLRAKGEAHNPAAEIDTKLYAEKVMPILEHAFEIGAL